MSQPQWLPRDLLQSPKHHRDMQNSTSSLPLRLITMADIQNAHRDRLLRMDAVTYLTSLGRSTIYSRIAAGQFPNALRIHGNCVAWRESEINDWIASRSSAALPEKKVKK